MINLKLVALAAAASLAFSTSVIAADPVTRTVETVTVEETTFVDLWTGAHVGAGVVFDVATGDYDSTVGVGYTLYDGTVIYGIELDVVGLHDFDAGPSSAALTGRIGPVIGDNVAVYVLGGVATDFDSVTSLNVGAGAEVKLNEVVGLYGEYVHSNPIGASGVEADAVSFGARFRF